MTHGLTIEQFVRSWRPVSRRAVDAAHSYKQNMRSQTQTDKHTQTQARGRLCVCVRKMVNRAAITTKPLLTSASRRRRCAVVVAAATHVWCLSIWSFNFFFYLHERLFAWLYACLGLCVCNTLQNVTQLKKFWRGSCRFSHIYTPRKPHTHKCEIYYTKDK